MSRLPCWFRTKLPWLCGSIHLFLVHALIDHTGDLHITTKGEPTHTVFGIALLVFDQRKVEDVREGKKKIEKQVELFHLDLEHAGRDEVTPLMHNY